MNETAKKVRGVSKEGDATVTLRPGETWVADQECLTYYPGNYLADWVPMNEGDPWHNRTDHEVTISIDYGRPRFSYEGGACTCWTTNGDVGCPDHDSEDSEMLKTLLSEAWFGIGPDNT